jgi:hypothetical protein
VGHERGSKGRPHAEFFNGLDAAHPWTELIDSVH